MEPEDFSLTTAQVRAAQSGDDAALQQLCARYLPRVVRIVAARVGPGWNDVADRDDLVQESFIDAVAALRSGKITDESKFCNWMARCVQNNIRDQIRFREAGKRRNAQVAPVAYTETLLTESILDDGGATPSQIAVGHETEDRLEEALRFLPARYRDVISLRSYCGMSFKEIATEMDLPSENTANVLFIRARAELLQRLQPRRPDEIGE